MRAGFAIQNITPPLGTKMVGWSNRDRAGGCTVIHDPLYVRALYLSQGTEQILVLTFDLCFVGRKLADQLKGRLGRELGLLPRQILTASSHTHAGPAAWSFLRGLAEPPDAIYLEQLERATSQAALAARDSARPARLWTGSGRTTIGMNRRRPVNGSIHNAPNPGGPVNRALPVCLIKGDDDQPIALLFSAAAHPVSMRGHNISADFCGVATAALDADLGRPCSMFLQGTAADIRPAALANGDAWNWDSGEAECRQIGEQLADEVRQVLQHGLKPVRPRLHSSLQEMHWPLQQAPSATELEQVLQAPDDTRLRHTWAKVELARLRYGTTPTACDVLLHGLQLGTGLRLVAIEGEALTAHGLAIHRFFPKGVTFALGYANGEAMYLPTSKMLGEGGYEVDSYWMFGYPAPLAKGMERILRTGLQNLRADGLK